MAKTRWEYIILQQLSVTLKRTQISTQESRGFDWSNKLSILMIGTYHLYFGNEGGKPGTIITFFPWAGARQGIIGDGQVGVTSYVVPKGAMAFGKRDLKSSTFHTPKSSVLENDM